MTASTSEDPQPIPRFRSAAGRLKRKARLLALIKDDPAVSWTELRKALGVAEDTVRIYMRELDAEGLLPDGAHERLEAQIRALSHRRHLALKRRQKKSRRKPLTQKNRRKLLLKMMVKNPTISIRSLASKLIVSTRTIERDRTELRREGFISGVGREPHVSTSTVAARRELRLRRILELLEANPEILRAYIASNLGIGTNTVSAYVKLLQESGALPQDFELRTGIPRKQVVVTKREERRPQVLACIARDYTP